jgi:O-antigen ligase
MMANVFTNFAKSEPAAPLITWTQNAAIFACCAILVSTAMANIAFTVFLILFTCVCLSAQRKQLATAHLPKGLVWAVGAYFAWRFVGLSYGALSVPEGLSAIFSDRKILYIFPLALIFSEAQPKGRFLKIFLIFAATGMMISFALTLTVVQTALAHLPIKLQLPSATLAPESLFQTYATQSMVFAMCTFLSIWFAFQQKSAARKWMLCALAFAFVLNIATITHGRSGYTAFLILLVWCFVLWRGFKGVILGCAVAILVGVMTFNISTSVHDRVAKGWQETQNFSTVATETSFGRRMVMYQTTFEMIQDSPVLGTGTGGFKKRFSAIAAEKYTSWRAKPFDDPHSQYLLITAENGLIGLAVFLLMLYMLLACCIRDGVKRGSIYGHMAAGCLLAWCATSLFNGHFGTFPEGHLIAFIVGILMLNKPTEQASDAVRAKPD